MTSDAIYIGTDKTEHWTKDQFLAFASPYFARGKAWAFKAAERHVFYDPNRQTAWLTVDNDKIDGFIELVKK